MKRNRRGFTLIELMIVVVIIGILAAIALPAYQDYTTRAKVTELLTAASACKTSVSEYYQAQAGFPADLTASGCSQQDTKYVASLDTDSKGIISVVAKTGPGAIDTKAAGTIQLVPTASVNGQLDWACVSTIPKKYLPANCR